MLISLVLRRAPKAYMEWGNYSTFIHISVGQRFYIATQKNDNNFSKKFQKRLSQLYDSSADEHTILLIVINDESDMVVMRYR